MKSKIFLTSFFMAVMIILSCKSSVAQLYWNQSCNFAGNTTSYVRVENSASVNLTGSFTLEAWVYANTLSGSSKGIMAKGTSLGTNLRYGIRLLNSGRFTINTSGSTRLTSRSASAITAQKWNHISTTYNSSTNTFRIYLNGVLDTSAVVAAASPPSSTDSLFIGISGTSTPFNGQLDEVRVWNRELNSSEVSDYMRTSLGTNSGIYNGLALSITFQKPINSNPFSVNDFSGNGNSVTGRNVTANDMTDRPYNTISSNECIELDGTNDYLSGKDINQTFPPNGVTFESWIFPRDGNMSMLFRKVSPTGTAFSVAVSSTGIRTIVKNLSHTVNATIPLNQWSHIAVAYYEEIGQVLTYLNGNYAGSHFNFAGSITSTADSVYIGGNPGSSEFFNGFIDELKFNDVIKNERAVHQTLYRGTESTTGLSMSSNSVIYKFDGNINDCGIGSGPQLSLIDEAQFSHSSSVSSQPRAPLFGSEDEAFHSAFYFRHYGSRIPETGTAGSLVHGFPIYLDKTITDVDVFVLLNHTNSSQLKITLFKSQTTDSLVLFDGNFTNSADENLTMIFDDQADSSIIDNKYSSFCSSIKPLNPLNSFFSGKNSKGTWMLKIIDKAVGDTGVLYSWGIRFNNVEAPEFNLTMFSFQQGFYNSVTNKTVADTLTAEVRSPSPPYTLVDVSKTVNDQFGTSMFSFDNVSFATPYYLCIKHRNTIETWSGNTFQFTDQFGIQYAFYYNVNSAFGANQIQVDNAPVAFAMYSGDVNQDGTIDISDNQLIDNDLYNFVSGYVVTDLTGDDNVDLADAAIADNNAAAFVSAVTP